MANPVAARKVPKGRSPRRLRPRASPATFIQRSRSVSSEEKAAYHNILGAGRRGTIRRFFDLGEDDQEALKTALGRLVEGRLKSA